MLRALWCLVVVLNYALQGPRHVTHAPHTHTHSTHTNYYYTDSAGPNACLSNTTDYNNPYYYTDNNAREKIAGAHYHSDLNYTDYWACPTNTNNYFRHATHAPMLNTHTLTCRPILYCMHAAVYGQGRQTERQSHVVLLHAYIQTHTDRQRSATRTS